MYTLLVAIPDWEAAFAEPGWESDPVTHPLTTFVVPDVRRAMENLTHLGAVAYAFDNVTGECVAETPACRARES